MRCLPSGRLISVIALQMERRTRLRKILAEMDEDEKLDKLGAFSRHSFRVGAQRKGVFPF